MVYLILGNPRREGNSLLDKMASTVKFYSKTLNIKS